eukprot:5520255-Prymnesium_polylepis.2
MDVLPADLRHAKVLHPALVEACVNEVIPRRLRQQRAEMLAVLDAEVETFHLHDTAVVGEPARQIHRMLRHRRQPEHDLAAAGGGRRRPKARSGGGDAQADSVLHGCRRLSGDDYLVAHERGVGVMCRRACGVAHFEDKKFRKPRVRYSVATGARADTSH